MDKVLETHRAEQTLDALSGIFGAGSSDSESSDATDAIPVEYSFAEWPQHRIQVNAALEVTVCQAPSAFNGLGSDETGRVIWGAAVHLARFLAGGHTGGDSIVDSKSSSSSGDAGGCGCGVDVAGKRVLELGCGCALVSIVATHLGASRAIATDYIPAVLAQARHHAELNGLGQLQFEARHLDWSDFVSDFISDTSDHNGATHTPLTACDSTNTDAGGAGSATVADGAIESWMLADVVLASDVIYGTSMLPALLGTIGALCVPGGHVVVATRDGRRGVSEFAEAMSRHPAFESLRTVRMARQPESTNGHDIHDEHGAQVHTLAQAQPSCFNSKESSYSRWDADHTIFVYRRRL